MNTIDWSRIDTVLLDMDGTVLDLAFDNFFWLQHVPRRWGEGKGLTPQQALQELMPHFTSLRGELKWYCLDHWSELLKLDVAALKHECREKIQFLPGAQLFLNKVRALGLRLLLVTNAHPDALKLKTEQVPLADYFEVLASSHHWGKPKEDAAFWPVFAADHDIQRERALFIDDSEAVLAGALAGGLGQVCGILAPDTTTPARKPYGDWPHVHGLAELVPAMPEPACLAFTRT